MPKLRSKPNAVQPLELRVESGVEEPSSLLSMTPGGSTPRRQPSSWRACQLQLPPTAISTHFGGRAREAPSYAFLPSQRHLIRLTGMPTRTLQSSKPSTRRMHSCCPARIVSRRRCMQRHASGLLRSPRCTSSPPSCARATSSHLTSSSIRTALTGASSPFCRSSGPRHMRTHAPRAHA